MKKNQLSLSIIVPVYNEENSLLTILSKLNELKKFCKIEIIVINDGSKDSSKNIIENNSKLYDKSIHLSKNNGKGKAVIEGLKESEYDYILVQDADLEYDPTDIIHFIDKQNEHNFDIILGSRFIGTQRTVLNFWHMVGNKFITFLFNILNNTTFSDIYCCYFLFRRKNININNLKCSGWGQQAEILTLAINKKSKIFEIGISYHGRTYEEGKKIKYYDVFSVIFWIVTTKVRKFFI
jgi:glycosyltransferase involved in cell wall biosynthesis